MDYVSFQRGVLEEKTLEYRPCFAKEGTADYEADPSAQPKEAFTGPYPRQGDDQGWATYFERGRTWDRAMGEAISEGRVKPEEAHARGYSFAGHELNTTSQGWSVKSGWVPLPKRLWHVTTSRSGVLAQGLMTRDQLGQDSGKGLGGGESNTISFTEDLETARNIYGRMLEGSRYARGETNPAQLYEEAQRQGFGDELVKVYAGVHAGVKWKPGEPLPPAVDAMLRDRLLESTLYGGLKTELEATRDKREARLKTYLTDLAKKYKLNTAVMFKEPPEGQSLSPEDHAAREAQFKQLREKLTREEGDPGRLNVMSHRIAVGR